MDVFIVAWWASLSVGMCFLSGEMTPERGFVHPHSRGSATGERRLSVPGAVVNPRNNREISASEFHLVRDVGTVSHCVVG